MIKDAEIFNQIAFSLADHFECVYYVDLESGQYCIFSADGTPADSEFPSGGDDFFGDATKNAYRYIHPDDLAYMLKTYDKEMLLANLSENENFTVVYRTVAEGKAVHMRQVEILCKDGKHIVCCLENIEKEFREKEEQRKNLMSAELMARRDELTGVKNSNAFKEYSDSMNKKIASGAENIRFGIVMCDINDLKLINDTRGHNYGDEAIQSTSRLICNIFQHSPVFRVGGDEFVVVIQGSDYDHHDILLDKFREESEANRKSRSGPVIASGMALYKEGDTKITDVLVRADKLMYENKKELKDRKNIEGCRSMDASDRVIPDERRRLLDALFGAMITVAGGGYIYLNDMYYDFSRWSLSLVDDFGLESEYMYHADRIWKEYIHPDDFEMYEDAINDVFSVNAELKQMNYRARKKDGTYVLLYTRGFVLTDKDGNPEYFGGIILHADKE